MAQNLADLRLVSGKMASHIIPLTNNVYDIGSAGYKIRDTYVSDESIYLGDNHKLHVDEQGFKASILQENGEWNTRRLATEEV
jgi:hypothetical protein